MMHNLKQNLHTYSNLAGAAVLVLTILAFTVSMAFAQSKAPLPPQANSKAEVGMVSSVKGSSLMIKYGDKKEQTVSLEKDTKLMGKGKTTLRSTDLKPDDLVVVISSGAATATSSAKVATASSGLKAVKVYVAEGTSSAQLKREAIFGTVASSSANTITINSPSQKDKPFKITVAAATMIKLKSAEAKMSDILEGQKLVAMGQIQADGSMLARTIHLIPAAGTPVKTASSSAKPKVTPTPTKAASSSATKTPTPTKAATSSATTH